MAFATLVLTFCAAATTAGSTSKAPANPVQVAHEPTTTSEIFVAKAAMLGLFEVEAGKVALTRSKNPQVRDFAQRMITEHNAAGVELTQLASRKSYSISVPVLLDSDHQARLKELQKLSDRKFDAAYGQSMREGHDEAVSAFTLASTETLVDADLRAFATKTLPALHTHHDLAMKLPAPEKD